MLQIKNISKSYEGKEILKDVSFALPEGEKKALVGQNGSGKSTLLKIIAGLEKPDSGNIERGDQILAYLPQEINISDKKSSVIKYLKKETGILEIEKKLRELEKDLEKDNKKLNLYGNLQERFEKLNGYIFDTQAKKFLAGFNLENKIDELVKNLSGGEKNKIALVSTLLKKPDILLLDEPTNNLDLGSIIWLEKFIKKSKLSCLITSHDKKFLDNLTSSVIQINKQDKTILEESGNYSDFLTRRNKEKEKEKKDFELKQEKIKKLSDEIKTKKQWAIKGGKQKMSDKDKYSKGFFRDRSAKISSGAKSKEKELEKIKISLKKPFEEKPLDMTFEEKSAEKKTKKIINLNDVEAGYEDKFKLNPFSLQINPGEKIIIMGDNGTGKSTLLKTIAGDIKPLAGDIRIPKPIKIGNFTQDHEKLPVSKSLFEYLKQNSFAEEETIYRTLKKFKFKIDEKDKKIEELSPGERARLVFASFFIKQVDTLILDEPTNHLDLESVDALEQMVSSFQGSLILVSHDRHFLNKIKADKLLLIEDKKIKLIGNYQDYISTLDKKAEYILNKI